MAALPARMWRAGLDEEREQPVCDRCNKGNQQRGAPIEGEDSLHGQHRTGACCECSTGSQEQGAHRGNREELQDNTDDRAED